MVKREKHKDRMIITAGSSYLDIDAYACCIAMAELLNLKGINAKAYSKATPNYSVCKSLIEGNAIQCDFSQDIDFNSANYIIVDVSDPNFLKDSVPLDRVAAVYDHHTGFEDYWKNRIGEDAHIEFIGAAATLIFREWKKSGLLEKMRGSTAKLLVAAILDNTLNLTSQNTTNEDREAFHYLCKHAKINKDWCAEYFLEVQSNIEADLKNSIFHDLKRNQDIPQLPKRIGQLCIWDSSSIFDKIADIRSWFHESPDNWMMNVIDIQNNCSYFVCDDKEIQSNIENIFQVTFQNGIAKSSRSYLRKEIIKKACKYC